MITTAAVIAAQRGECCVHGASNKSLFRAVTHLLALKDAVAPLLHPQPSQRPHSHADSALRRNHLQYQLQLLKLDAMHSRL